MTATTIRVQMAQRKDTAANWTAANPILLSGEIGYETDTKKFKIGNGSTNWNSLAYLPIPDGSGNLTITGNLEIGSTGSLTFEGSTADGFETTLAVTNPTADRTITLPNQSGNVLVSGNASIIDADIAANAEIAVSKLADGTARQLLQTDAAGTGVEWASNVDIPGTLDVTGAATFDAAVTVAGDLTVNGTTTTISTQNLLVEDKNIIIGDVAIPTDVTADGGGITLKGATDKTINWVDATDAWTSSERFSVPLSTAALPSLTFTGDPNTGIYSPGADQVAISTGGSGRLFVNASGGLGVGTSSPSYTLDVAGNARIGAATGEANLELGAGATGNRAVYIDFVGDTTYTDYGFRILRTNEGANAPTFLEQRGTGDFAFNTIEAAPLIFKTNSSERLRITPAGYIGIGQSTPNTRLHINDGELTISTGGNVSNAGGIINFGISALSTFSPMATVQGLLANAAGTELQGGLGFFTRPAGTAGQTLQRRMTITDAGNVGIGITNPGRKLTTSADAGVDTAIQALTSVAGSYIQLTDSTDSSYIGTNNGSILFLTPTVERARIDSSGRLLVGTSSDSGGALFQVNGDRIRVGTAKTPASATDTGTAGEICWDASYVYVCTATNTWKRSALSTW